MSPAKQKAIDYEIKNYLRQARQLQKTSEMFADIVIFESGKGRQKKTTTVIVNTNAWKKLNRVLV